MSVCLSVIKPTNIIVFIIIIIIKTCLINLQTII